MPVDPGGRKRGLNQAKPPRKRQPPPVTPPDQQDRQRAHRQPPATPPDQAERQKQARKSNFRRGAPRTGGPGRVEIQRTNRLITRVEKGRADTREVQRHLRRQGFDLAVDNNWGPQTQEAWKSYLHGLATGQEQYAADHFHRQRDYLRNTDLTKPGNPAYERQLFGEDGFRELELARENLRRSILENQTNPDAPESRDIWDKAPVARALRGIGTAFGEKVVEDLGELYQGDFAGAYAEEAELLTGPELIKGAEGKDVDPKWLALEAVLLPFRPIASARAGVRGALALPKGRAAVRAAAQAEYRGPGLAYRGARKFKVGEQEFIKESSRSAFGRSIDRAVDRLRNTNKQAGRTQAYSTKFQLDTKNVTVDLLRKTSRGLNDEQEYALRILAEGATPEERMAHHLKLAKEAPRQEIALYHLEHAAWNKKAAKYLELNPAWQEGSDLPRVIVRPAVKGHTGRAVRRLEKAWGYFQETGQLRQDLLQEIGRLQDERIMYRLHAPARVVKGARYEKFEKRIQAELEADPARQQAFEWIDRQFADDPVQANAAKALYDSVIRSTAEETGLPVSEVAQRIRSVESKVSLDEIPELGAFYQTVEAAPHTPGLLPFREMAQNILSDIPKTKLPQNVRTPASLAKKIDELYSLVRQGADYRGWYGRAAQVWDEVAKDLGIETHKLLQIAAIMSAQANPTENLRLATRAIHEITGGTLRPDLAERIAAAKPARFLPGQRAKVEGVLEGRDWSGRKTNSFYANLLKYADPERYAKEFPGREVTVDRHIAFAFTGKDQPEGHYDGMERVFQEMADVLGWAPEEVQAAAWVPIKAGRTRDRLLKRFGKAKPVEEYLPSGGDAYERGQAKYKGELYQREGVDEDIARGVQTTLDDGGFTWNGDMTPFKGTGFGASYEQYNIQIPVEKFDVQAVKSYREAYDALLQADPNVKIGTWLDPETGDVHLDLTQIFKNSVQAEDFAVREHQQAYFDYNLGEVRFPRPGAGIAPDEYSVYDTPPVADDIMREAKAAGFDPTDPDTIEGGRLLGRVVDEVEEMVRIDPSLEYIAEDLHGLLGAGRYAEARDVIERQLRMEQQPDELLDSMTRAKRHLNDLLARETGQQGLELGPPTVRESADVFDAEANLYEAVARIADEAPQLGRKLELIEKSLEVDDFRGVREIARNLTEGLPEEQADMIFPLVRQIMESALTLGKAAEAPPGGRAAEQAAGFQQAAAEELQNYAAMARDVANTLPEEEWPAWVRNQIRAQQEEFPDISRRTTEGEYFQRERVSPSDSYMRALDRAQQRGDHDRVAELYAVPPAERGSWAPGKKAPEGFTEADEARLAEVNAEYDKVVRRLQKEVNPYAPGTYEQARRNRTGSRRSRMGQKTTGQETKALAEDELTKRAKTDPKLQRLIDEQRELTRKRDEWQETLFQKGGNLEVVSPYGIKGAVAFDENDLARVFLTDAADQTTLAHELSHVMRRLMPRVSPNTEAAIAKFSGAEITNKAARSAARKAGRPMPRPEYAWSRDAEEKFARGVERVLRTGVAPTRHKKEFAALARAFSDVLEESELPDVPFHVHKAIQKLLFDYEPKAGGRIFGHEDVKYGISYAPTWRGVPFRMTHPHRAMGAYVGRAQSHFFGGGRGRAVGGGPDDQALRKSYEGAALISGFFNKDVVGPLAESGILASRMSAAAVAHRALVRAGSEIPQYADDIAVKVDPSKELGDEIKRFWDKTKEFGDRRLRGDEFDPISFELIEEARRTAIPFLPGHAAERDEMQRLAQEAIDTGVPIDNIVWVPREFMDASGLLYVPQSAKYQDVALRKWMTGAGLTWDVVNDLVKAQILWLNPAYAPVQFLGNTAMNLMHQGPFALVSGYKSVMMLRKMELEHRLTIDRWMGEGIGSVIAPRGHVAKGAFETLHRWNSVASDILPRRMAFMHEARRDGYKSIDQVADLARRARAGDQEAIDAAEQIARRAKRSIVDFDNLTPFEREVVTRWIFFYPWLRSATDYSVNFVKDHPLQAITIALMYEHFKASQQDMLGDHPYYSNLDVPFSTESVGLKVPWTSEDLSLADVAGEHTWTTEGPDGEQIPLVFKLRQAFSQSTPLEIAMALKAWSLDWDSPESAELVNFLTPTPYGIGVALWGYDPYEGKEVPRGPITFFNQAGITSDGNQAIPIVDRVKKLFLESEEDAKARREDALYPREKVHEALRVFGGSLAPTPYNPRVGQERAMEDVGGYEEAVFKLKRAGEDNDLPPPSDEVLEDLRWNKELFSGWRSLTPLEKAKRSTELYDKRFGTNYAEKYIPRIETEEQAAQVYETLNPRLYPRYGQYRSWVRKRQDVKKGLTSVSD